MGEKLGSGPNVAHLEKDLVKAGELEKPRIWQMPPADDPFEGIENLGVGPQYTDHIRKGEYHVEYGGPKTGYLGCYIVDICDNPDDVEDICELYGPDTDEMEPNTTTSFIQHVRVYGENLTMHHMEYLGRAMASAATATDGWMFTGSQSEPWIRLSHDGLAKYDYKLWRFGALLRAYLMTTVPLVDKMGVTYVIGEPFVGGVKEGAPKAVATPVVEKLVKGFKTKLQFYDELATGMQDEDVDTFYGCSLCKMIAPNHACVTSPTNIPFCGFATWSGLKVAHEVEPGGYAFSVRKGERIDPDFDWYDGVDAEVWERSNHSYKHFFLNSALVYPATNCGCFEAAVFYIPEVDGLGIVHRRYTGGTPLGIPYSTIAGFMSGGEQNHGFKGVGLRNTMMKQFLSDDGGWDRVVWMPLTVKEEIADNIPEEIYDKIATENDALEPEQLKEWLRQKNHPIVAKFWSQSGGEPDPISLPAPSEMWPEDDFQKARDRVRAARKIGA